MSRIHTYEITVSAGAIDANGHANNIEFVRWMQEAAVAHADAAGCTAATREAGATWVVRSHQIEYLRPAMEGDRIEVRTWVADFRRAFSRRKYDFVRMNDRTVLARGETNWVFVEVSSGRPRSIPPVIAGMFELVPDEGPKG
jgi:acyl-CoA thioester hydrolase